MFQLAIFDLDGRKNGKFASIPLNMHIPGHFGNQAYKLHGVGFHCGPDMYQGHYRAMVYDQPSDKWLLFSDAKEPVEIKSDFTNARPLNEAYFVSYSLIENETPQPVNTVFLPNVEL
jgi:hypothetical protein